MSAVVFSENEITCHEKQMEKGKMYTGIAFGEKMGIMKEGNQISLFTLGDND